MVSHGKDNTISLTDIESKISEADLLHFYLGIEQIPCVIQSPLRVDNHPSFGLYTTDGIHIFYKDFSTSECGNTYTLLSKLWGLSFVDTLRRVHKEFILGEKITVNKISHPKVCVHKDVADCKLEVKIREWKDYDIEYWKSYGITLEWLKWAEVYPISHKIITKEDKKYIFPADKYAYAYIERKEGNITIKIYQPFNTKGFKWANKHDRSVVSLWTKIPENGDKVVICSSLKDALCLSANTKIPALAVQGEGYGMSDTAIKELKRRFTEQYILLDNDDAGIKDAIKLAKRTGFTNIVLPQFEGGKDVSDYYKLYGKSEFIKLIKKLFEND